MDKNGLISIQLVDRVASLRLSRSRQSNSLNDGIVKELRTALVELDEQQDVRAIVLSGEGKGFCAGSDLKYIAAISHSEMCRFEADTGEMARLIGLINTPVLAAIDGFAIGGGLVLAASCDLVVAARSAKLAIPELTLGWLTPWGIEALISRVGRVRARTLCLDLFELTSDSALAIGLVDQVCDDGLALETALALAARIADKPLAAVRSTKQFFARRVLRDAELTDLEANLAFGANVLEREALATLSSARPAA